MLTERLIRQLEHADRAAFGRRASTVGIVCNLVLVALKAIAGVMSGSISVVADAVNNLMDAVSNVVSLVGFRFASKPADEHHPYGHGRSEYLAGLGVAVLVVLAGADLVRGSIEHILHPTATHYTTLTLVALVVSMVAKLWLTRFYWLAAERIGSRTLEAASRDSRNDVLATGAVLAGVVLERVAGVHLDAWLGLCVGAFVVGGGIGLLRDTADPLLGASPDPQLVERVRRRILSYPGVLGTHDLLIHDYGPDQRFASAHVEMRADADPLATHETIDQIERDLRATEGLVTVLHNDPIAVTDTQGAELHGDLVAALKRVDERLSMHDLHVERDGDVRVLCFDCVVPPEVHEDRDELAKAIEREVSASIPHVTCRIVFDTGFVASAG
ncbi:MAG: cation diffusion facilitator family transporter [Coriobacteriales bacterium]|nr:cation diffusion facilitator family transporter [Coriobacteriales bacterium]